MSPEQEHGIEPSLDQPPLAFRVSDGWGNSRVDETYTVYPGIDEAGEAATNIVLTRSRGEKVAASPPITLPIDYYQKCAKVSKLLSSDSRLDRLVGKIRLQFMIGSLPTDPIRISDDKTRRGLDHK